MIPGEYFLESEPTSRSTPAATTLRLTVAIAAIARSRSGSHCHFFEVNRSLAFDRARGVRHAAEHRRGNGGAIRTRRLPRG